jgi:hypothetical protein
MKEISRASFEALAGYTREPGTAFIVEEISWFSSDNGVVLGMLARDRTDDDFSGMVLGRDSRGRYRAVHVFVSIPSLDLAKERLRDDTEAWSVRPAADFHQGDERGTPVDVFLPVVPAAKFHPSFARVSTSEGMSPARAIIESMMPYFEDVDGNFVEQFQSTAFDARFWELYLFAALTEDGFAFDRTYHAPDYVCRRFDQEIFVEAVTVNPTIINGLVTEPVVPTGKTELQRYLQEYMPIKWGSALTSKLNKKYWELPHVAGRPIVLAIQDFHVPRAMTFTGSTLLPYLYGLSFTAMYDAAGNLSVKDQPKTSHTWGAKTIESGFFSLPGSEHISAVLSNPTGTISKFNRMAILAGMGSKEIRMIHHGFRHDMDPNASVPKAFSFDVNDPSYTETWTQGINVFHNPNALHPLDTSFFTDATHSFYEDGKQVSYMADFHPYNSQTTIVTPQRIARPAFRAGFRSPKKSPKRLR